MRIAMQEPTFVEFADACMKVLHPEEALGESETDFEQVQQLVEEAIEKREGDL